MFRLDRIGLSLLASITILVSGGCCKLVPWALQVDPSLTESANGNGILEPGESVAVQPTWNKKNDGRCKLVGSHEECTGTAQPNEFSCFTAASEDGSATSLAGPSEAAYSIEDGASHYAFTTAAGTRSCGASTNCYAMSVGDPTVRPGTHWDAHFTESLTGTKPATKNWMLHVGRSFDDVPTSSPFYAKIETLLHHELTAGCAAAQFCPDETVTRSRLAIVLARAIAGGDDAVPESGISFGKPFSCTAGGVSLFSDVAAADRALQVRPLHRRERNHPRLRALPVLSGRAGFALPDRRPRGEVDGGRCSGNVDACALPNPHLLLRSRRSDHSFQRCPRRRPFLQARPLSVGKKNHRRMRTRLVLPRRGRDPRPDGQVRRERVRATARRSPATLPKPLGQDELRRVPDVRPDAGLAVGGR